MQENSTIATSAGGNHSLFTQGGPTRSLRPLKARPLSDLPADSTLVESPHDPSTVFSGPSQDFEVPHSYRTLMPRPPSNMPADSISMDSPQDSSAAFSEPLQDSGISRSAASIEPWMAPELIALLKAQKVESRQGIYNGEAYTCSTCSNQMWDRPGKCNDSWHRMHAEAASLVIKSWLKDDQGWDTEPVRLNPYHIWHWFHAMPCLERQHEANQKGHSKRLKGLRKPPASQRAKQAPPKRKRNQQEEKPTNKRLILPKPPT
jgi:hypothetical protein